MARPVLILADDTETSHNIGGCIMHLLSPVVQSDDTESIPRFEALPDLPADEELYFDELRAAIEADAPPEFAPLSAEDYARAIDRFPFGYPNGGMPFGPQVALMPGTVRPFVAQLYVGTLRIDCGRFRTHEEAMEAVIVKARSMAAARIRDLRRRGKCPRLPRLRERQPWRFLHA
jgi:hypothetical protein